MNKKVLIRATGLPPIKNNTYRSGIPRSNIELIKAMIALNDKDIDLSIYCPSFRSPFYHCQDWPIEHYWYGLPGLKYHCKLEPWWREHIMGKHDLVHLTENADYFGKNEKFVITIHDTDMMNASPFYDKLFKDCAKHAKAIVTCSEYSKMDIIKRMNVTEDKITVIPWGISKEMFYPRTINQVNELKKRLGIVGNYFFACSCKHPRKNVDVILEAFSILAKEETASTLVISLSNPEQKYIIKYKSLIDEGRIKFLSFVSDEELAVLYTGALASILVSSLEGFGFPILESMACGTNCICCQNTSMTEIGADKAIFVRHRDAEDLANAFYGLIKYGKGEVNKLIDYSKKYSWNNTAKQYLEFYKKYI